jgi:hypothetical protein
VFGLLVGDVRGQSPAGRKEFLLDDEVVAIEHRGLIGHADAQHTGLARASVTTPIADVVLRRPCRADRPEIVRWAAPQEYDYADDADQERATGNPKRDGCVHGNPFSDFE